MYQLTRPALTQASAGFATVTPKTAGTFNNDSYSSEKHTKQETAAIKPESIEQILAEIRDELKEHNRLTKKHQDWLNQRSFTRCIAFCLFGIPFLLTNKKA